MTEILELSAAMIDTGELTTSPLRITNQLSELADGVAVIESFSNVVTLATGEGLVLFDTSGHATGAAVVEALRRWSAAAVDTIVYTHGHVDHVGGSGAFVADGQARGDRPPRVVGHALVPTRFARYRATNAWNVRINRRQFGGIRPQPGLGLGSDDEAFLPVDVAPCTDTYTDRTSLAVDGATVELRHARGETDDHTWAWVPSARAIMAGDFFIWAFPNAGNPQKVQRYPLEWAGALRSMAAMEAELFVPAHGLPIAGAARIATVLGVVAGALETLVADVLDAMNAGATLDQVLAEVHVDPDLLALPYLRPSYDEPEFVVRNVWRAYGGWWDGNPAHLKPPRDAALAAEIASLAGGAGRLAARAQAFADDDIALACALVELAATAAPGDAAVHETRAQIYAARRAGETSLMAKGIYAEAAARSGSASTPPG